MRILLVQLSDIHLSMGENPVLGREAAIAAASTSLDGPIHRCVLLFTGDIAFSGSENEYLKAMEFIGDLTSELERRAGGAAVDCIMIPGNHDCNLSLDQAAREMIVTGLVGSSKRPAVSESIIELCTDVQRSFFELRDAVAAAGMAGGNRLYYEYRFQHEGEEIEFRCLNTAWVSRIHESEGQLYFPEQAIPPRNPAAALSVTLMHHPFNWFPNENKREVQRKVEETTDIILTGHEHAHTRRTQLVSTGERNQFIEGVALQTGYDADDSGFNVLLVDSGDRQQLFVRFEWNPDEQMYSAVGESSWEPFQVNQVRTREAFSPAPGFTEYLQDPGAGFEKANKGRVRLGEIFVYPELREQSLKIIENAGAIRGEEIFDHAFSKRHLLITGPEQSGKTALAKAVYARVYSQGYVPLLLRGDTFSVQKDERLLNVLDRHVGEQYGDAAIEKYRQLDPQRRVIIVDSLHKLRIRREGIAELLNALENHAGRVILITNDLAHAFGEIVHAQTIIQDRAEYGVYRLLPFGYLKRSELTSKWFLLDETIDEEQLARRIKEAENAMDIVLGKNYVPAFPVFILAMLQGVDSAQQVDVGASTYGYFYELLIRNALAVDATKTDFSIRIAYLTFVAFALFEGGRKEVTERELKEITARYSERYDIAVDFAKMTAELERRHVLLHVSDSFEFQYQYIYYYFVAKYLSEHITEPDIRVLIAKMSNRLDDEENANVLLFLAHLSTDPLIIDEMMANAKSHFPDVEPARLEEDVEFLASYLPALPKLSYEEADPEQNRRAQAEYRDAIARSEEHSVDLETAASDAERAARDHLNRLLAALKTLQILGQLLKNHFGNVEAGRKEAIARECYELGFRILGSVNRLLSEGRNDIVAHVVDALRADGEEDPGRLLTRANAVVIGLALACAHGTTKRISFAVGHPQLEQTYARVEAAVPSAATKLVNMSIRLDQFDGFPRGEILHLAEELKSHGLASGVLQWLVINHMNLFPVNFKERQKVCDGLGITYTALQGNLLRRRLLGPGARK